MKEFINYFYNLNIDNIRMVNDDYYFTYKNDNFIFNNIKDAFFDEKSAFELNLLLLNTNSKFSKIILNRNKEVITKNANKMYVLMMYNLRQDREFDYSDIVDTNIVINNNIRGLNRFNWGELWIKKIDYFESFIEHNMNKYQILNEYYNYFIGLSENAILYFKDTIESTKPKLFDKMVVCHKKIEDGYTYKSLYNPTELIIDHPSRDLSNYLKFSFWNRNYIMDEIVEYLNKFVLSDYSARMLMSRMLFPSFFFDSFEKLMDNKLHIKDIMLIIDKMEEYEKYVLTIYKVLRKKYIIPEIYWIKKADYSSTFITPKTSGISLISMDSMPSLSVTSIMLQ